MKWIIRIMMTMVIILSMHNALAEATIEPAASNIPQSVVDELVASAGGAHVTIHEWGVCEAAEPRFIIGPVITTGFKVTSKVKTEHEVIAKDEFIISVARGMSITLTDKATFQLACSISGTPTSAELGINAVIIREYSVSVVWNGPSENSPYNTRSYRIRFFENRGTYEGYPTIMDGVLWDQKETGTWKEPASYALYSLDSYIAPLE